ncbi:MAG: methyltransferase domain-containing protein [Planctomycetota bacterium]
MPFRLRFTAHRIAFTLASLLCLAIVPGERGLAQDTTPAESDKIPAGINDTFKSDDLDVEQFLARFEVESREVYGNRDAVLKACAIQPGETIADIGAGTGFYSRLFAKRTGLDGWVYSVDISPKFLQHIVKQAAEQNIPNLTPVLGSDRSVCLPLNTIDLAFICDTYHHFESPQETMASLFRAMKPGGRVVLIDFERIPGKSREWLLGHVRAGKETFRKEVESVGFQFGREVTIKGFEENYFLIFRKPSQS